MNNKFSRDAVLTIAASFFLLCAGECANAVSVTYTFDQFPGDGSVTTPILNAAPDSGPASFLATFSSSPTTDGFAVFTAGPSFQFSGNDLLEPTAPYDTLTVSLNMPITEVSVDFALRSFNGGNSLFFFSSSGNTSQPGTPQSPSFDGGTLIFASAIPFTGFSLNTGGSGPEFAIDNLVMRLADTNGGGGAVPENGATLPMISLAALILLGSRRVTLLRSTAAIRAAGQG